MNSEDLRNLYEYTDWANDRMLAAIAQLSQEDFARTIVSSFPSIRATLTHIASAEWVWLKRWRGESPTAPPAELAGEASVETLSEQMHAIATDRRAYLSTLDQAAIDATFAYRNVRGEPFAHALRESLVHCANHSTYHRGQLATMLRQVGAVPPGTDYIGFVREKVARV